MGVQLPIGNLSNIPTIDPTQPVVPAAQAVDQAASTSSLSSIAPATTTAPAASAPAASAAPSLPANPTSAQLKAAGYSLQTFGPGGNYSYQMWVSPTGQGATYNPSVISQNDTNAQAASDAAAAKAGNFTYVTVGQPYNSYTHTGGQTQVAVPNADPNYKMSSTLANSNLFSGNLNADSESHGALSALVNGVNSGNYAVQGNTLILGNGQTYNLQDTGTSGIMGVSVPDINGGGSYAVPISVDSSSGKASIPDNFLTQGVQYVGGQSGGFLGNVVSGLASSLAPIAPLLSLASIAAPELAPIAAAVNTGEAVANNNPLAALASATGIPGVTDAVGGALGVDPSTVKTVANTANQANNLVNAVQSGNTLGALSAGANLTGAGSTQIGDSGLTVSDAVKTANLANAINSGNTTAIATAAAGLANSPTVQSTVGNAINPSTGALPATGTSGSASTPVDNSAQSGSASTSGSGGLPTNTSSNPAGFNTLSSGDINSILATGAVTAGQGTQTASSAGGLPATSPPNNTTSSTYPPDIGATWDANTGRWIDPSGNGYWTMSSNGGYTYKDFGATSANATENGTGTGAGTGSDQTATTDTSGATTNANGTTASNTGALSSVTPTNTQSNPGLTAADVNNAITSATSNLPTTADVNQAITSATSNLPTSSDVQNMIQQAMANNPNMTPSQVQDIVTKAIQDNPGMTTDQVNTIVQNQLSGVQSQVGALSNTVNANQAQNASALSSLTGTVNANQAQTNAQLQETNQNVANLSALDQANYAKLTDAQQSQAQALAAQGVSLSDAINQVAQSTSAQITGVQNSLQNQLAQSDAATQDAFNKMSTAQQAETAARVAQGQSLQDAITASQQATSQQIGNVQSSLESQLNDQGKSLLATLQQQGVDYNTALNQAIAQQNQQISANQAQTESQISGLSALDQANYNQLNAAQQAQAQALASQGMSLSDAINQVQSGLSGQITALSQQTQDQLAQADANTQAKFNALTSAQQAQADALTAQGASLTDAINQVAQQNQSAIGALSNVVNANQAQTQQSLDQLSQTFQDQLNASDQATKDAFNNLSSNEQALAATQAANTGDLKAAIADVQAQSNQAISGVGQQVSELSNVVSSNQDVVTQRINDLVSQGLTQQQAIDQTNQELSQMSSDLNQQIAASDAANQTAVSNLASSTAAQTKAIQDQITQQQQQAQAKQALADASKFIDVKNPWLTVGKSQDQGLQEEKLQQIFNSLDPALQVQLARGTQQAATGGSIHGIDPDLYSLMMNRMGYPDGGLVTETQPIADAGNMLVDMNKTANSLAPKFVKSEPKFFRPQAKGKPMELGALTQLKQAPKLGALAHGGLPSKYEENAPKGHKPEFITGLTGYYAGGRGTGQSDDIPAMLHDGDYVIDAEAVSALGDGSSKAGKDVLTHFMHEVPHRDGAEGNPVPAKIADGEFVLPESFVTALGGGDNKHGAKMLDEMRKRLREHKRSAPLSKIPPKAKSPLDYLKGVKG
jgi:hypothetical protein